MNISEIQNAKERVAQQAEECFKSLKQDNISEKAIKKIAQNNRENDRMYYEDTDHKNKEEDIKDFDSKLDEKFYINAYKTAYIKNKKIECEKIC